MNERASPSGPNSRKPTPLTPERFLMLEILGEAPKPRTRTQPRYYEAQASAPRPQLSHAELAKLLRTLHSASEESSRQNSERQKKKRARRQAKLSRSAMKLFVGAAVAAGVVGGGAVLYNNGALPNLFADSQETSDLGNGMDIEGLAPIGAEALKDTQCTKPNAVLMAMTVSGSSEMIPALPNTTPQEYMKESIQRTNNVSEDLIAAYKPFDTESGYNEVTLNKLPLYVTACATDHDAVQENSDGSFVITRNFIAVQLFNPNDLFKSDSLIKPRVQVDSAIVDDLNTEDGEYMTYPKSMYLGEIAGNESYNTAVKALNQSMQDQTQIALMLAAMETDIVRQLDGSLVDGVQGIRYPDGTNSLQNAIDHALLVRLGISNGTKYTIKGDYPISMAIQKVDGKPITDGRSLTYLQLGDFDITALDIEFGFPTKPKPKPDPSPSPSETHTTDSTPTPNETPITNYP